MRKAATPDVLRRSFEVKARFLFHPPWSMQTEWDSLAGADALWVRPRRTSADVTLLYFHGGGAMVAALSHRAGAQAVLPRYPLAPEHAFPAAIDHALAAYRACHALGQPVVVGGDSAGGALALSLLGHLLDTSGPLPAATFAFSPLTDLAFSGASIRENAECEAVLPAERASEMMHMYLADADPMNPRASPLYASFRGAPPVWITVGDTEILRDDSRRIVARMQDEAVDVTFVEERDLPHVWPSFHNTLPEARRTLDALAAWIKDQAGASAPTR